MRDLPAYADLGRFVRSWVSSPLQVAALMPSSKSLANLITREVLPGRGPILELGPGTGVFTRALLARGVREADLTLVECGSEFARLLEVRFPQARILWMDAAHLGQHTLFPESSVAAVVSGLPLLNMPPRKTAFILEGAFSYLQSKGAFYQFTYGLRCPISPSVLRALGLKATRVGGTLLNLPPAAVYRVTRA